MADEGIVLRPIAFDIAWNVRGDPARTAFASGVSASLRVALSSPGESSQCTGATLLWLGPRSWLLVADAAFASEGFDAARASLGAAGGALFDVSSAYVGWVVSGREAPLVLGKSCPLDFDRRVFKAGICAQSMLGHAGALFYRPREAPSFVVIVARSFADDAWHELCTSAQTVGYRVETSMPFSAA